MGNIGPLAIVFFVVISVLFVAHLLRIEAVKTNSYKAGKSKGKSIGYLKAYSEHENAKKEAVNGTPSKEILEYITLTKKMRGMKAHNEALFKDVKSLNRRIRILNHTHENELIKIRKSREITLSDALTIDQTAEMLGCDPKTLYRWRKSGRTLEWFKFNGLVLYRRHDVEAFLDEITSPKKNAC